jgi:drug/metabolite transporter (DMT)-like permease
MIRSVALLIAYTTCTYAFVPSHRAWITPKPVVSRLTVGSTSSSSSSSRITTSNSTSETAFFPFSNDKPETFFQEEGIEQFRQLQALEKLVQTTESTDGGSIQHLEQESVTRLSTERKQPAFLRLDDIWKARLLLLGASALYGTNFSIIKIIGDSMPVGISASLRFGLASLATLPWLLQPPKDGSLLIPKTEKNANLWQTFQQMASTTTIGAALAGFEVGMWNSVGYLAQAVGLETTDASKSAFICSLAVVIVPLLNLLSGKQLLSREIFGAVMAVAGVGVLEMGGLASGFSSGDVASLLQPLFFGVAFWRMETAMRKYPQEANRSTAAQLLAVFLTSSLYCLTTCDLNVPQIMTWLHDPKIVGSLFFTGIITTALTIYMEAVAMKTLTAAETTLLLSTEPLFGAGVASLLIGESFGVDAGIGAFLIIAGCIFSNLGVDGVKNLLSGNVKQEEVVEMNEGEEKEEEALTVVSAEKAIVEVGLIGAFAQLIAWLEADILIGGAASLVAAEEIVEEVITKDLL